MCLWRVWVTPWWQLLASLPGLCLIKITYRLLLIPKLKCPDFPNWEKKNQISFCKISKKRTTIEYIGLPWVCGWCGVGYFSILSSMYTDRKCRDKGFFFSRFVLKLAKDFDHVSLHICKTQALAVLAWKMDWTLAIRSVLSWRRGIHHTFDTPQHLHHLHSDIIFLNIITEMSPARVM